MIRVDDIAWSGDLFQRNKIVSELASYSYYTVLRSAG